MAIADPLSQALLLLAQLPRGQDQSVVKPEMDGGLKDMRGRVQIEKLETSPPPLPVFTPPRRSDEELFQLFRDGSADLSRLSLEELRRLEILTRPVTGGLRPLVPWPSPNPEERPYGVIDPQTKEYLWFKTAEDADWFLRSLGRDPFAIPHIERGLSSPLPGAWTLPPWPSPSPEGRK